MSMHKGSGCRVGQQNPGARPLNHIYDPVEGGFFRYAETRDWKIPHYENLADLNAATVLLLYRLEPGTAFRGA